MLTPDDLNDRMDRVGQLVAELSARPEDPAAVAASQLLGAMNELHAAALQRVLAIIRASPSGGRAVLEQFAQDDLIRSLLLVYDLHPIDARTRIRDAVDNLGPLVESYGGRVSLGEVTPQQATVRLYVPASRGPSPVGMLKDLLENAILVTAPDVAAVHFDERPPEMAGYVFPILGVATPEST